MDNQKIRNFCIIAHIDHGKSTLADRFLEVTGTIEKRKMQEQFLDLMELERERGITIKMQPVRMRYKDYIINLIDTPGHIDFNYEVSRALKAVEGAILLVDATQGVQAQTITNVEMAKAQGLKIVPVVNKIDLPSAMVEETKEEIYNLLGHDVGEIFEVSGKTGMGVEKVLDHIIDVVPPPVYEHADKPRALVFDFEYSNHQGVILYVRVTDGAFKKGDEVFLSQAKEKFIVGELGTFSPTRVQADNLSAGEIGYIVTSIKKPSVASVGDSLVSLKDPLPPLPGYMQVRPVVWASVYPQSQDDFDTLRQALERLRLTDSSISYEEENNGALGRGFRCGFLGMLHLEIIMERLHREFDLDLVVAAPTITYKILFTDGKEREIYSSAFFPEENVIKKIYEPWVDAQIIVPDDKIGPVVQLIHEHEGELGEAEHFGNARTLFHVKISLRELMRNFFDELKSASSGYASLSYKVAGLREAEVVKLKVLVAEEEVVAFSKIISKYKAQREAEDVTEKLKDILPRALFVIKIQAVVGGRILASRSIPALKKDVTAHMYGGDRTRKMKLWKKQKKGKERLKQFGRVEIPQEVFIKMMQNR